VNTSNVNTDLEDLLREAMQHYALVLSARKQKADNPLILDLIEALLPGGPDGLPRPRVIESVERSRRKNGMLIPPKFEESVQSTFNQHCLESEVFKKRPSPKDGMFHSRRVGRYAYWLVDEVLATAWVAKDGKSDFGISN